MKTNQIWFIVIFILILFGGLSFFSGLFHRLYAILQFVLRSIYDFIQRTDYHAVQAAKVLAEKKKKESELKPLNGSEPIFQNGKSGQAGYCYIGEDRGFRSCIEMGIHDKCMSGEIYNTKEICENPELREG